MAKVAFVSHASEDAAIAASITEYLERNGVSCWIAPRDVAPGGDYGAEIVAGIESSATFVLVLSEHANESIFVKREVERAVSKGKPIFPIRVREVLPSRSLELFISSAHWIDAWQPPIEKYLARLAQSISAAAKVYDGSAGPAPLPPSAAPAAKGRRRLAMAAAIALLLLGAAGWYAYGLLGGDGSAPAVASIEPDGSGGSPPDADVGSGAASPPTEPQVANLPPAGPVSDLGPCPQMLAINRSLPTPLRCTCGAGAAYGSGAVWGTDIYTDDSTLCLAAVHAGVIGAGGGTITVLRGEGRPLYIGSTRNGVTSHDFGSYAASISFDGTAAPAGPEPCPATLSINRSLPTPFRCTCGAGAASLSGAVWGTDVYTDDSTLCLAAVHAGAIGPEGGTITVVRSQGRPLYVGSARNGVTSHDFGSYVASVRFE